MSKAGKSELTESRVRGAVESALSSARIVSVMRAMGLTGIKIVSDQGEWELPEGDYLLLGLSSRAVAPSFGAEMVNGGGEGI